MSKNVLESFLESFHDNKSLRHWLHWWHDRRSNNIFRAFTGHDNPSCNQDEGFRASWKSRNETGLPFYKVAEFDTRDYVLSEAELAEVMHTTKGKGCGPTLTEMSGKQNHYNIAEVAKKEQDLVDFGIEPEPDEMRNRSDFNNKSIDGSKFCKKERPDYYLKMFENRLEASYDASLIMKLNKSSIINALKRSYLVSNSLT